MKTWKFILAGFVLFFLLVLVLQPVTEDRPAVAAIPSSFVVTGVERVAKLTGSGSVSATDSRFGVLGTDLGIMWDNGQGQVMLAFGDTYGQGWSGCGTGPDWADWRSNVLALSSTSDPAQGLYFSSMSQDKAGHAGELLPALKVDGVEHTVIPTAGISIGTRNYLYYMSVNHWGQPGTWYTNYSGVAYSDDNGQNWTVSPLRWENNGLFWNNNFQQTALVKEGGYVYLFGTPNGRFGNAYLGRVPQDQLLDKESYRYWDGENWQRDEASALPIVAGPVGELSVQYNSYFGRWLMTYLDESQGAIVLRDAPHLDGPWTDKIVLASSKVYPQLYGGFIHPWFNNGPDLYFTMSQWCSPEISYNVSWMHARLALRAG
jgi:hypothetical protein